MANELPERFPETLEEMDDSLTRLWESFPDGIPSNQQVLVTQAFLHDLCARLMALEQVVFQLEDDVSYEVNRIEKLVQNG